MPVTRITDLIDPQILADMILEKFPNNALLLPSLFTTNEFEIGEKGTLWQIPYQKTIQDFETFIPGTSLTPQKFEQDKYRMVVIRKAAAYALDKVVKLAAYKNPMDFLSTQVSEKMIETIFRTQLNILEGGIPAANRDSVAATLTPTAIREKGAAKIGDKAATLRYLLCHSKVFEDLIKGNYIVWQPKNTILPLLQTQQVYLGTQAPGDLVPTVAGLIVVVSDHLKTIVGPPTTYVNYLLGDAVMGYYWQQALNIDMDKDILAKEDVISPDFDFVLCLHGVDYTVTAYDDVNLATTANYTLKWNQKLVPAVRLVSQ